MSLERRVQPSSPVAGLPVALRVGALVLATAVSGGCRAPAGEEGLEAPEYVISSVVLSDSGRTTYVQALASLDVEKITNANAIEIPGNGVVLARGRSIYIGLAEEPTWVRYTVDADGKIAETGRLSFLNQGMSYIDYGNAMVDVSTAISISSEQALAIVWDPEKMTITGTIDLPHLEAPGYELEVWTTVAHNGRVYVPGRWANWAEGKVRAGMSMTILDPKGLKVLGVAEDDRCSSGGRINFGPDGTGYVMGDGRNYSLQMFAEARGETPTKNCLLRIKPGQLDFDPGYMKEMPSLTGGREAVTELDTPAQGSGWGFTKLLYRDHLPEGVQPVNFDFWGYPVFKYWRVALGEEPTAVEVNGLPFSTLGFDGSAIDGKLYVGESPDYATSVLYEVDPSANTTTRKLTMDGLFYGLIRLH